MKTTFLNTSQNRSPLKEAMTLRGGREGKKSLRKELGLALPLTSLIDAFSIIVIYLLIGTQSSGMETSLPNKMNLPLADHSAGVDKEMPILKIEKGNYYLNEEIVPRQLLVSKLAALKKNAKDANVELMVQADTEMQYAELDPLLKAGSQAGIEKLKFAVVPTR